MCRLRPEYIRRGISKLEIHVDKIKLYRCPEKVKGGGEDFEDHCSFSKSTVIVELEKRVIRTIWITEGELFFGRIFTLCLVSSDPNC